MSRVVITGATGFIGRHLLAALQSQETEVVATVRHAPPSRPDCSRSAVVPFDLARPDDLRPDQLQGTDLIYHLAAHVHVMRASRDTERQFQQLNAHATQILAETAARAGVRRFVYLSSIKVNGERTAGQPFTATDDPAPEDAYGRSKLDAERALARVAETTNLEIVIVRPPLVYGSGVGANFRRLISLVNAGLPLPFGAIANQRSLVSVWNLVSMLSHVGRNENAAGRAWLVSDGDDVSTPRLLGLIGNGLGRARTRLLAVPVPLLRILGTVTGRNAEIARLVESLQVDSLPTRTVLGWQPSMGIDEGIARTVAWFKATNHVA